MPVKLSRDVAEIEVSSPALLGLLNLVSFPSPKNLENNLPPAALSKNLYPSRDIGTTRSQTGGKKNKSRSCEKKADRSAIEKKKEAGRVSRSYSGQMRRDVEAIA